MIQSRYPTLRSPVAGPLTTAISPKSPLDWARGQKKEGQPGISWQENRLPCAVNGHTVVRCAHQPMQP